MKLSAPWIKFMRELEVLFAEDDDVKVVYDDDGKEVKLYVADDIKADALNQLLPNKKTFGNVTLKVTVVPANAHETTVDLIERAFRGNPALSFVFPIDTPMGHFDYVVFKKQIVQFFNDDISDINGNCTMLYQDVARDVFGTEAGLFFCTDAEDKRLQKPLGEWP